MPRSLVSQAGPLAMSCERIVDATFKGFFSPSEEDVFSPSEEDVFSPSEEDVSSDL
jgi:hypothetical protein